MTPDPTLEGRILIVDDEPANVRLLERILQEAGYTQLHTTTNARQVADLFAQLEPDLILLDLHRSATAATPCSSHVYCTRRV